MPRPPPRIRDARAGRARLAAAPRGRLPALRVAPSLLRAPLYRAGGRGVKRPCHARREVPIDACVIGYSSSHGVRPPRAAAAFQVALSVGPPVSQAAVVAGARPRRLGAVAIGGAAEPARPM